MPIGYQPLANRAVRRKARRPEERLLVFVDEAGVQIAAAKGWVFQQGRRGLINPDFGQQAVVVELSAEDRAELARAPEREPEILLERTP